MRLKPLCRQSRGSPAGRKDEPILVNWRTSMTYDATIAIAQSIKDTNNQKCANLPSNKDQCRQQIQKKLTSSNFIANGMMHKGSIKFDQNGDRKVKNDSHLAVLLEVKKDEQDSFLFEPHKP